MPVKEKTVFIRELLLCTGGPRGEARKYFNLIGATGDMAKPTGKVGAFAFATSGAVPIKTLPKLLFVAQTRLWSQSRFRISSLVPGLSGWGFPWPQESARMSDPAITGTPNPDRATLIRTTSSAWRTPGPKTQDHLLKEWIEGSFIYWQKLKDQGQFTPAYRINRSGDLIRIKEIQLSQGFGNPPIFYGVRY